MRTRNLLLALFISANIGASFGQTTVTTKKKKRELAPNEQALTGPEVDHMAMNDKDRPVLTKANFEKTDSTKPSFVSVHDYTPEGMKWVRVEEMSDEFNYKFDTKKWFKSTWNYGVPVFMSKSEKNSGVNEGKLWIKATLNKKNPDGRWFQSARIHSRKHINYPMYTECSMKTAHISAYNTFWLNKGDGKNRDEIDIVENNSKPAEKCTNHKMSKDYPTEMNSQYFLVDDGVTERNKAHWDVRKLSEFNPKKDLKWNETYHTVGVWWKDARHIQFFLDGEAAGSITTKSDFTREMQLIWDLWTFDPCWLGGLPEKKDLKNNKINTMKVDWVRTWQLEEK